MEGFVIYGRYICFINFFFSFDYSHLKFMAGILKTFYDIYIRKLKSPFFKGAGHFLAIFITEVK